jgi:hypothetical protein
MSRLHQSIQQVHLISYMESMLTSPLFAKLPAFAKTFLRRKLYGLEGRYRNICEVETDSYDEKKLLPNFVSKTIKDKCNEYGLMTCILEATFENCVFCNFRLNQKREDPQVTIKTLQTSLNRMERQMAQMTDFLAKFANQQDPNLRFNLSTTQASSLEDSLSDGDQSTARQIFSKDDLDNDEMAFSDIMDSSTANGRSPIKRESQMSMASAGTLEQIREMEDEPKTDSSSLEESGRCSIPKNGTL